MPLPPVNQQCLSSSELQEVCRAATVIRETRPVGQVASLRRQLAELWNAAQDKKLGFQFASPVAMGAAGGRLRIAFMHPDMGRFYGPAWQTPLGAKDEEGTQQILLLVQEADDRRVHLNPLNPLYQESVDFIESDWDEMYPDLSVSDWYSYEEFGTKMSRQMLYALGYFSAEELENRRLKGIPLPPESLWVENNMRRPFSLVGNAIASLRTHRQGEQGERIAAHLGREYFRGLRIVSTGSLPQGGFSSSSALTVATKNGINALFQLGLTDDQLIHLACQAEYGTGVRAGSLDQATEQKGEANVGTLLSSNPRDHYRTLGRYPIPADQYQVLFPYSVERDRESWRWSAGFYSPSIPTESDEGVLTTIEMRKMTGKAAEIAAILLELPLDRDFFEEVQEDFLQHGQMSWESRKRSANYLRQLPLFVDRCELRSLVDAKRLFYAEELQRCFALSSVTAHEKTASIFDTLFEGWRNPLFPPVKNRAGDQCFKGVPLRAMLAYLFGEVAKNFQLIHHPEQWIEYVRLSQRGDRCCDIDPQRLPDARALQQTLSWEKGLQGPARLEHWLLTMEATRFDFNQGLTDEELLLPEPPEFHRLLGTNFFRGLPLIDLAEAMLTRAFGTNTVAVRVNAAGQGDYFQVHVDTRQRAPEAVKQFLQEAFYDRFDLNPPTPFIEIHPGGGALGVRLSRFDLIPHLIEGLGGSH